MTAHDSSVLRLLADGEFHSGAGLARALGISRSTVWNAVRALSAAGLDVYRVKSRGYRLAQPVSLLETSAIVHCAGAAASRFTIDVIDIASSTNMLLLQRAAAGAPTGSVLAAEWQQAGRGRMQREWHAAIGGAITFSVLWRFTHGAAALAGLSLAVGVALTRAIARLGVPGVQLKWPNDVLWGERKVGGVLIEMQGDALGPSAVVIGIGVNVRLSDVVRERIGQPATDLETACGRAIDRSAAVGFILAELASVLDTFSTGGFAPLREEWLRRHAFDGRRVVINLPNGRSDEGIIRGVDENGAIIFDDGTQSRRLHSAEISVRRVQPHARRRHTLNDRMPRTP
jgi:BirA family transcriptional regulator, biotin operon repressor / biotin---[acetyl-CoA-carboxylase] ligase